MFSRFSFHWDSAYLGDSVGEEGSDSSQISATPPEFQRPSAAVRAQGCMLGCESPPCGTLAEVHFTRPQFPHLRGGFDARPCFTGWLGGYARPLGDCLAMIALKTKVNTMPFRLVSPDNQWNCLPAVQPACSGKYTWSPGAMWSATAVRDSVNYLVLHSSRSQLCLIHPRVPKTRHPICPPKGFLSSVTSSCTYRVWPMDFTNARWSHSALRPCTHQIHPLGRLWKKRHIFFQNFYLMRGRVLINLKSDLFLVKLD